MTIVTWDSVLSSAWLSALGKPELMGARLLPRRWVQLWVGSLQAAFGGGGERSSACAVRVTDALSTRKLLLQPLSVRKGVSICRAAVELRWSSRQDIQAGSIAGGFMPPSKRDWPKVNEECQLRTIGRHCRHGAETGSEQVSTVSLLSSFLYLHITFAVVVQNANRGKLKVHGD